MSDRQIIKAIEEITGIMGAPAVLYDRNGRLLAATDGLSHDPSAVKEFISSGDDRGTAGDILYLKAENDYIILTPRKAEQTGLLCLSAVNNLSAGMKFRKGRQGFYADLFAGRLSPEEILEKTRVLKLKPDKAREVFIIGVVQADAGSAQKVLSSMYPESGGHAVVPMEDGLISVVTEGASEDTGETARTIADMMNSEAMIRARVAYGNPARNLNGVEKAYQEAVSAYHAGLIFSEDETVLSFNDLREGRLVMSLPEAACRRYLHDVFGESGHFIPNDETRVTIDAFFDNDLNISETGRKLFLHRNTLVYRLEKLQKETGLDIRRFRDAMSLRLALMAEKRILNGEESTNEE